MKQHRQPGERRAPMTPPSFCGVCTNAVPAPMLQYDPDLGVWACKRCREEPVRLGRYTFDDAPVTGRHGPHAASVNGWGGTRHVGHQPSIRSSRR